MHRGVFTLDVVAFFADELWQEMTMSGAMHNTIGQPPSPPAQDNQNGVFEPSEIRRKKMPMSVLVATLVFVILTVICMIIAHRRHDGTLKEGLVRSWDMFEKVWVLILFAYIFSGYIEVLLPRDFIARWLGRESGILGILLACIAGGLTPGGPFVSMPIAAALYKAGAGEGVLVAYLSAWSLYAVGRLPIDVGFLSFRFAMIRLASVLIFPPLAGLVARAFFEKGG
jgi:uncharacterized membrane protein YraQ (UPF0718 family)